jgi:hypothetical protein
LTYEPFAKEIRPSFFFGNVGSQTRAMYSMRKEMYICRNVCGMQRLRKHDAVLRTDALIVHAFKEKDRWCMPGDVLLSGQIVLQVMCCGWVWML